MVQTDLDDPSIKKLFDLIKADPELAKMFLEANPGLLDKLKCIKNPDECEIKLFDVNGDQVDINLTVELKQLELLMSLVKEGDK